MLAGVTGRHALLTSRFAAGEVVPMPMLPFGRDEEARRAAGHEVDRPIERPAGSRAMLLIRYSCVTLLKPWNCPSAPFWS